MQWRYWLTASGAGVAVLILLLVLSYLFYRQKQLLNRQTIETLETDQKTVRLQSLLGRSAAGANAHQPGDLR